MVNESAPKRSAAPKGEHEIYTLYGNPLLEKNPEIYWKEHGVFCFVQGEAFVNCDFLRRHKGFWCHRAAREAFSQAFNEVVKHGCADQITSFDGCYNHRPVRGGTRLSLHSFGAAIDINAKDFPLGSTKRLPEELIKCFTDLGFTYGGDYFKRPDPMHFEYGEY